MIMASEVGALEIAPENVAQEGPARAGQDVPGRPRAGPDRRRRGAEARRSPRPSPTASGSASTWSRWPTCPRRPTSPGPTHETLLQRQQAFGYTLEDLKFILGPMGDQRRGGDRLDGHRHAAGGALRPRPAAVQLLQAALRPGHQSAARRDPRGAGDLGVHRRRRRGEPARADARDRAARSRSTCPILDNDELARLKQLDGWRGFKSVTLPMLFPAADGAAGMEQAPRVARSSRRAPPSRQGANLIILSDRGVNAEMAPIPSLLACSGLHHHLVRAGPAVAGRPGHRVRRRPRGPPLRPAARLRRRDDQPVRGLRDARRHDPPGPDQGHRPRRGGLPLPQGDQEGGRQGDVQDGHQHDPELPRRPDLRGDRPERGVRRPLLRQDRLAGRRRRPRRDRPRDARPPPPRLRHPRRRPAAARGGRPVPVAARRRVPPVQPRDGLPAPARHPGRPVRHLQEVHPRWSTSRTSGSAPSAACSSSSSTSCTPVPIEEVEPVESIVKRFATGAMSLRLDLGRGARDAGHRHEPAGRQVATPARGARTPRGSSRCPTATASAARSSRWPRAGSA